MAVGELIHGRQVMILEKFMLTELCERTGIHRNTVYNLLQKGVIKPVEVISGIKIYSEKTVDQIKNYYGSKNNNQIRRR